MLKRPVRRHSAGQGARAESSFPGPQMAVDILQFLAAASLTRCCRRCLSSRYYEFTSYTIGHPESSHYARNMEILQRRTNCGPGNAKGTQESSWHCRPILPHISSSTQHPVISTQRWSRMSTASPFLAASSQFLVFSVQTVSVPNCPVMISAHTLLFSVVPFWTCLYCGNKNKNLHVPCFSIHNLALHLPPARLPL